MTFIARIKTVYHYNQQFKNSQGINSFHLKEHRKFCSLKERELKVCRVLGTCSCPNHSIWEGRSGTLAGKDLTDRPNNPHHSSQPRAIFEAQSRISIFNWRDTEFAAFVAFLLLACRKSSKLVFSLDSLKTSYINILER